MAQLVDGVPNLPRETLVSNDAACRLLMVACRDRYRDSMKMGQEAIDVAARERRVRTQSSIIDGSWYRQGTKVIGSAESLALAEPEKQPDAPSTVLVLDLDCGVGRSLLHPSAASLVGTALFTLGERQGSCSTVLAVITRTHLLVWAARICVSITILHAREL